jgi:hypothetical protein
LRGGYIKKQENMGFKNMKFNKTKLAATIVISIILIVYLFWNYFLKPSILWEESYRGRRFDFLSAILSYEGKFGRLPTSLEEMVSVGCLPEKSNIYSCPILHGTCFGKVLPYTECEYTITFDPNKIVMYMPEKVFDNWRFKHIDEKGRKWKIRDNKLR